MDELVLLQMLPVVGNSRVHARRTPTCAAEGFYLRSVMLNCLESAELPVDKVRSVVLIERIM